MTSLRRCVCRQSPLGSVAFRVQLYLHDSHHSLSQANMMLFKADIDAAYRRVPLGHDEGEGRPRGSCFGDLRGYCVRPRVWLVRRGRRSRERGL